MDPIEQAHQAVVATYEADDLKSAEKAHLAIDALADERNRLRKLLADIRAELHFRATEAFDTPYTPESLGAIVEEIDEALGAM